MYEKAKGYLDEIESVMTSTEHLLNMPSQEIQRVDLREAGRAFGEIITEIESFFEKESERYRHD